MNFANSARIPSWRHVRPAPVRRCGLAVPLRVAVRLLVLGGAGLCASLPASELPAPGAIRFRDATESSGIHFLHTDGSSGARYILETVASGLGLIDYDGDGYLDILFLNGQPLPGTPKPARLPTCALYHNNRDGTFTDVTAGSGLEVPIYALGCAVADYDNDGREDILITCFESVHLFHNNGNGTFTDVTQRAGLANASGPGCVGAGCLFLDYDRDGLLDIFIGNYLQVNLAEQKPKSVGNVPIYARPRGYPRAFNRLYHNNGDGTFRDVSQSSGIGLHPGYAMGVVSADFDGDGWPDIFVANDEIGNCLFHNLRNGTFEEVGVRSGVAYDQYGDPMGTMGANVGDYDGDGRFDIIVTSYQNQHNTLYRNLGNLQFQDVTVQTGAGTGSGPLVTWGCGLVDFDNDGVPELFTAAGHLQDTVELYDGSTTYKQHSLLLQERAGRFVNVTPQSGDLARLFQSSRGAVFGDLNNDGKVDIVVLNSRSKPALLMNVTSNTNHWVLLKLMGAKSNRSAVGALVRLSAGGRTQCDEVRAGRGYQSADDLRLHFGLGANSVIDRLQIRWPDGLTDTRTNLLGDRILRITEGQTHLAPQK